MTDIQVLGILTCLGMMALTAFVLFQLGQVKRDLKGTANLLGPEIRARVKAGGKLMRLEARVEALDNLLYEMPSAEELQETVDVMLYLSRTLEIHMLAVEGLLKELGIEDIEIIVEPDPEVKVIWKDDHGLPF